MAEIAVQSSANSLFVVAVLEEAAGAEGGRMLPCPNRGTLIASWDGSAAGPRRRARGAAAVHRESQPFSSHRRKALRRSSSPSSSKMKSIRLGISAGHALTSAAASHGLILFTIVQNWASSEPSWRNRAWALFLKKGLRDT